MSLLYPLHPSVVALVFYLVNRAILAVTVWALVDAAIRPETAFRYVARGSKALWVAGLAIGTLLVFLGASVLSLFGLAILIGAIFYLVDMRPKLREVRGGRSGPYGPW
jgi:cobalamin synthase